MVDSSSVLEEARCLWYEGGKVQGENEESSQTTNINTCNDCVNTIGQLLNIPMGLGISRLSIANSTEGWGAEK